LIIEQSNIKNYIPQREPFIMIDNLLSATNDNYKSNFLIRSDNIFLRENKLEPYGLIENIAQTCAAGLAASMKSPANKSMDGFLASISRLEAHSWISVNDTVQTEIIKKFEFDNMYAFEGICYCDNELILKCEMKIVRVKK
jgi:predicted hotdog family 3-hydroxylacyl-ACP dehydratase